MIRVILADDHAILRDGIRAILSHEPDIQVVGEAGNGQALLELLATQPADLVLLDVSMPVLDGFATTSALRAQFPGVHVLVLSMLDQESCVYRMMQAGALGYVLKNADITEITYAIRTVAAGRPFLCTEIGLSLLRRATQRQVGANETAEPAYTIPLYRSGPVELSVREMEVLKLIAEGLTNAEIADQLFASKRTIETHRQNIIEKTQAKNTAALIRYAMLHGLIE
ncbi:response regulator transcription factor [Hymenobacter sp. HSC-4F20]|uniref:response regulator transcription factor n=1 Tax=Hymenobacter sp. HSC-4F20 TaxID=2864135 RepID=UPI001C7332B6|nr:response regulator transcription factor [Hymenobacter sp. HSC-4F20]MBX0291439.1 response regulator transcription factor [Hymenobacter sp. HSC-4F20]